MSEVTIPGRSINSTINSMKSLGSIGTQVLNDHGIDIVDLEKYYPVKINLILVYFPALNFPSHYYSNSP